VIYGIQWTQRSDKWKEKEVFTESVRIMIENSNLFQNSRIFTNFKMIQNTKFAVMNYNMKLENFLDLQTYKQN